MRLCRIVLCLILTAGSIRAQSLVWDFKYVGLQQGLTNTNINALYKGHFGFVWIGTANGLNRYDGYGVKQFYNQINDTTSLLDNYVQDFAEYHGVLIVGTRAGLSFLDPVNGRFINLPLPRFPNAVAGDDLYCMRFDGDSNLWMGTRQSRLLCIRRRGLDAVLSGKPLDKADMQCTEVHLSALPTIAMPVSDICFDPYGHVWLGSLNGLMVFDATDLRRRHPSVALSSGISQTPLPVYRLYIDNANRLWTTSVSSPGYAGTIDLAAYNNGRVAMTDYTASLNRILKIGNGSYNTVKQDRQGNYWMSEVNSGVICFTLRDGGVVVSGTENTASLKRRPLLSNNVERMLFDDQNNAWFGTTKGVAYANLQVSRFVRNSELTRNGKPFDADVHALCATEKNLWIGTGDDGAFRLSRGTFEPVNVKLDKGGVNVYNFLRDPKRGTVWTGTDNGLYALSDNDFSPRERVTVQDGAVRKSYGGVLISLALDKTGDTMWIGKGRGLDRLDLKTMTVTHVRLHLLNARIPTDLIVRKILFDAEGVLWIASDQGLIRYNPLTGSTAYDTNLTGHRTGTDRFLTLLLNGPELFIGTQNNGLYRYIFSRHSFRPVTVLGEQKNYAVASLQADNNKRVWAATSHGLLAMTDTVLMRNSTANPFNLLELNMNASAAFGNLLVFGHSDGIATLDPAAFYTLPYKPRLAVTDFNIQDRSVFGSTDTALLKPLFAGGEAVLQPSQNFFSFEYALLDYANTPYTVYRYKLDGLDERWIEAGRRRFASYTHVPPGGYRFLMQASTDGGVTWITARPVLLRVKPRFDQTPWFVLAIVLLVTGVIVTLLYMRYKEQNERRERESAEAHARMKEMFLANMSHEIRTPLNAIIGINKLLLEKSPRTDQVNYLNVVQQSSEHLKLIVDDILDYSKIDMGHVGLETIPFSLTGVMQNVRATLQLKADEKGLHFVCRPSDETPDRLIGDPYRLTQILMNLGSNAIKFTHQGDVIVTCRSLDETEEGVQLEFSVTDTGIGIRSEDKEKLFESFTQASSSTTRKYGGTGLGLAICKQLVTMMGGTIAVHDMPVRGTAFVCRLAFPLAPAAVFQTPAKSDAVDFATLLGIRVLLVEDNAFNQTVAQESLRHRVGDIRIDTALNGLEAVDKAKKHAYDIILMDVVMPEMDGYEATRQIRTMDSPNRHVPILAMTANIYKADMDKCRAAGMNDAVNKPFEIDELVAKMSALLKPTTVKA